MILFNFSVLARPAETLALRQPDPDGRKIWNALFDNSIGRMCLIINEDYDRNLVEHWLKKENYKPSFYEILDEPSSNLRAEKIHRISAVFGKTDWYIDNDPRTCAETLRLGIPTLLVACPYIIRPEWDGGRVIREWDTMVEEMDKQAIKQSEKEWRD